MNRRQKKSVQAINYFANKSFNKTINKVKLLKLLWIADKYHLLNYGRPILKDHYVAMELGPVPTCTIDLLKHKNNEYLKENIIVNGYNITSANNVDTSIFSESDIEIYDLVWKEFGQYNEWELVEITHEYPEWKKYENDLKNPQKPKSYPMDFLDFYEIPPHDEKNKSDFFLSIPPNRLFESKRTMLLRQQFEA